MTVKKNPSGRIARKIIVKHHLFVDLKTEFKVIGFVPLDMLSKEVCRIEGYLYKVESMLRCIIFSMGWVPVDHIFALWTTRMELMTLGPVSHTERTQTPSQIMGE